MTSAPETSASAAQGVYRGPKTLSVVLTYTCPAECADCGTLSSPRDRTNLPLSTVLKAIDEAREQGFYNVVFTGGEPTLRFQDLLAAIAHARAKGLVSRIVTNAYWATSLDKAFERIDALMAAGIIEINYSTGDEHARFVPVERVVFATEAAIERGLRTCVMIELRQERRVTQADIQEHPRLLALGPEKLRLLSTVESPWMPLDPLAKATYPDGVSIDSENVTMCHGCDSVLQTYVLEADGRIGACCGLGMRIVPELNVARAEGEGFLARAVEEAENDFLKVWLRYRGPEKILAWAAQKDPSIDWENRYGHRCQACLRVYKDPAVGQVIREHYSEIVAEVLQCVWFDEELVADRLGGAVRSYRRYSDVPARVHQGTL